MAGNATVFATAAAVVARLSLPDGASPDRSVPWTAAAAVGFLLVLVAARRGRVAVPAVVVCSATMLIVSVARPPGPSHDLWSYLEYGRMLVVHHRNPYVARPADFAAVDWPVARISPGWRQARSVYGPLFVMLSAGAAAAAGTSVLAARLWFQGTAAAAFLATLWLLRGRRVSVEAFAAVALNPLIMLRVVHEGHNDALVGAALLAGVCLFERGRAGWAAVFFAAAVMVKPVAALALVGVAAWAWWRGDRRQALWAAVPAAAVATAGYAAFGLRATMGPLLAASRMQSRASVWSLVEATHVSLIAVAAAAAAGGLVLVVAVGLRAPSAAGAALVPLLGFVLLGRYVLPWYFAWALPVAALAPSSRSARVAFALPMLTLAVYEYRVVASPDLLDVGLGALGPTAGATALGAVVWLVVRAGGSGDQREAEHRVGPGLAHA